MNVVDGRTIRWAQTDGGQLFKLMGPGKLFEKEMIRRIREFLYRLFYFVLEYVNH